MPHATNPIDGVRTYFEDSGGSDPPVVLYPGFADPLQWSQASGLARALEDDFRLIFADHRGQGRSDKPHEATAYALPVRTADAVAILDTLDIERAHFLGFSWGARLGFAIGEHAPERVRSLVLCGNQPYAWNPKWPLVRACTAAVAASRADGAVGFVETFESLLEHRFPEPDRTWMLDNDPAALDAAWSAALAEGPISSDLTKWQVPCLIYAGAADTDIHANAERAAAEIPGARFLSLAGRSHFSAADEVNELLPYVLDLFRSTTRERQS
jgi:pimeloyl-ACP methyl ester carboxylesterase